MPGLESLIPNRKTEPFKKEDVFLIDIDKIKANPLQPRKHFDDGKIDELARSIEKYGILEPLIVRRVEKDVARGEDVEYQIIAGERRYRAAQKSGLKRVPVIVRDIKREDEMPLSLIENIQRVDLNAIEKANAFKYLLDNFDITQEDVAKMVGKSRVSVANTLRLLRLPKDIQESLRKGEITEGHARAILARPTTQSQLALWQDILHNDSSVRETEQKAASPAKKKSLPAMSVEIKSKVQQQFRQRVELGYWQKEKPRLTIYFNSQVELDEFLKKQNI